MTVQNAIASQVPFHKQYISMDTPETKSFIEEALASATEFLGKPDIPVHRVYLRLSTPINTTSNLRRGFQLTELVDKQKGIFAIYLNRKPDEYAFYGQLAHEVAHLLNAQMYDAYVEGINTVFAEILLKMKGLDWSGWEQHFHNGNDPLYSATYFMMKDVAVVAGENHIKTLLSFSRWTDKTRTRKHIDINAWLLSLPNQKRQQIKDIIKQHAAEVKHAIVDTKNSVIFVLPQ